MTTRQQVCAISKNGRIEINAKSIHDLGTYFGCPSGTTSEIKKAIRASGFVLYEDYAKAPHVSTQIE